MRTLAPLRISADPYGFFGAYQVLAVPQDWSGRQTATAVSRSISLAIFGVQRNGARRLVHRMAAAVVEAFCTSRSLETTIRRFEFLQRVPRSAWTNDDLAKLKSALADNPQIRNCVVDLDRPTPMPEAVAQHLARLGKTLP